MLLHPLEFKLIFNYTVITTFLKKKTFSYGRLNVTGLALEMYQSPPECLIVNILKNGTSGNCPYFFEK